MLQRISFKVTTVSLLNVVMLIAVVHCTTCGNCTCSSNTLNCAYKSLTSVPSFDPQTVADIVYVYLDGNRIDRIGDNAFISFQNNSHVSNIQIPSNRISSISDNAFAGVEHITTLYLANNELSALPRALQNLSSLRNLYLNNNPLLSLDPHVMTTLGNTLRTFSIDLQHMTRWPTELHFLRHLQTLQLYHLNETHLNKEMFHGFQGSLQRLDLYYTQLHTVSSLICDMPSLHTLSISNSPNLNETNHAVFEACKGHLSRVTSLTLNDSPNLTVFPVLGHMFSTIQSLVYQHNNLEFFNADSVSHAQSVTSLNLYNNKLTHVPYAISKFTRVTTLNLAYNLITDIEDPDFAHLTHLQNIYLYNNPLVYISNNAFRHNVDLRQIQLYNTQLRQLPTSLKLLPKLNNIYLSNTLVECTCDLANLKGWNVTSVNFNYSPVKCFQSSLLLKDFIQNDLNTC